MFQAKPNPNSMELIPTKDQQNSSHEIHLPPGFRFHPSDEELVSHYLRNKLLSIPLPAKIVADVDIYKCSPWELPSKASFGKEEWFFFSPRDRKYPNGNRPNRAAGTGYWKATGTDKNVLSSCGTKSIGIKKALVFYRGRPPRGIKTDWIMTEYRSTDAMISWTSSRNISTPSKRKGSMRLDDWVLCRIRNKSSNNTKNTCPTTEIPSDAPRRYFENNLHVQACPVTIVDCNFDMDFPMLPHIFPTSQNPLPSNVETPSVISTTISIPSLNETTKSHDNGSQIRFQFSAASVSEESLFHNRQPNKTYAKNMDYHQLMNMSLNHEAHSFWYSDDHLTKDQSFVNDDHILNHESNFQYDHEAVQSQTFNWEILGSVNHN